MDKDLYSLFKEIQSINNSINSYHQQQEMKYATNRLIDFCFTLKSQILELSLKLPSPYVLEHYLRKVDRDGYILVIKLINDSWRFINCYMLFDKPIKNLSREDILKHVIGPNYFDYNENKNLNYSVIKYCEKLIKSGLIDYYQNYYSEIHNIVRNRGIEYGFNVNTDFVILQSDAITEFSKKKLSLIWQYLVDHKHIDSGDNNDAVKKSFIDFWSNSIFCNTVKIKWISTAKNKGTNFSLLYVFGEIMGLDMAKIQSKQRLCSCFIDKTGIEIDPKQIKRRNESASQKKFKSDLLKIKNSS